MNSKERVLTDDPAANVVITRKQNIELEIAERTLEACRGVADMLWIGEDLSTQRGPMISMELYRKCIRPWHEKFTALAKTYDVSVMFHSCGSCSWLFEDFIEIGIDAIDTLQPEAQDMEPRHLKNTFGDRLSFHGCIPTGGVTAHGTSAEVTETCRGILEIMTPGGGYRFAPSHDLQDNTPTENALAMYQAAKSFGAYRKT